MQATSTRPPGTNRVTTPPAARMRSVGASLGTISSPLKRYTRLTVEDEVTTIVDYTSSGAIKPSYVAYGNGLVSSRLAHCLVHMSQVNRSFRWWAARHPIAVAPSATACTQRHARQ